jgi:hypothetical protein
LLSCGDLGLGLVWVRSEVELVGGVRVVAGDGVRGVVGDDLVASLARSENLRMGLASVSETVWEVLMEWGGRTQWLDSRLACDGPWRRRVQVGGGSMKDRLDDQRGGSEWEPIKILLEGD